ncbi:hypothetical protein [Grimontia sp. SpTr1]|uniref:hypothetical protein n=1 Tax=Grimontia sp. SpTr1 TaxID=2995319 RepID=UPI00248AC39C|nr:hypothetical protein [Grimontia sp. SpTr1]
MERQEIVELYECELSKFYENMFEFWNQMPSEFISGFVEFFPKTIYLVHSRGGDLPKLKEDLNSFISNKVNKLVASVEKMRADDWKKIHTIHIDPPLTFTQKSINNCLYPAELSGYIDKLIDEVLTEIYTTTKYSNWMQSDFPKINHFELSKFLKLPNFFIERMKRLRELELQALRIHQEDRTHEVSKQREIARDVWTKA